MKVMRGKQHLRASSLQRRQRAAGSALLAWLALACGTAWAADPAQSAVGLWKSVDDETNQPKALIRIVETDGVLSGRVEKILTPRVDAICDRCTDERKGQPVLGMTIVEGLRPDAEEAGVFDGGEILDPNNGKVYRSRARLVDGGRSLEIRGYIGVPLFGRTQTWIREP